MIFTYYCNFDLEESEDDFFEEGSQEFEEVEEIDNKFESTIAGESLPF